MEDKQTKVCAHCKRELPVENFCKSKKSPDGLQYWCKECVKEKNKEAYNKRNKKEKIMEKLKSGSRRVSVANAEPRLLMRELALRGYKGNLYFLEKKTETIEHEGHNGTFEYEENHVIDIAKCL